MTPIDLKFIDNAFKHGVTEDEIWQVFLNGDIPCVIVKYLKSKPGNIYNAYGVTDSGRYLVIGFVKETKYKFRVIHAMDMNQSGRKRFKKLRTKK